MKYIRLLRLQDQYILSASVVAAVIYLHLSWLVLIQWVLANLFLSITAFMVNELVDREDVDKYSWNKIHIKKGEIFDKKILVSMFIIFTILGLYLSYRVDLLVWGIVIYVVGLAYSVKPIRLKARFFMDIVAQMLVWVILPFIALLWLHGRLREIIPYLFGVSCIIWAFAFPYQLADYEGDRRVGLHGTHVVLGIKTSLIFGLLLAVGGLIFYFVQKTYLVASWSWLFVFLGVINLIYYIFWLRIHSIEKQLKSLQQYVTVMKSIGYLIIPYLLIWMFV